ncbi:hypothetical protein L3Q82_003231 [Scortum barcoo]|uniref:Uncharacterized protein n=1 Tax=Scortum barcoo TaxID=214431 RepID=A0ACB8VRU5_9TELE|nr:hypothetical protein L3Q82_003231 [Scortum barcoo]
MKLDSLVTVAESRTLDKLLDIMDNASHPLHTVISNQRSLFSERLLLPKCRTNRLKNSFVHHAITLYNSSQGGGGHRGGHRMLKMLKWLSSAAVGGRRITDPHLHRHRPGHGQAGGVRQLPPRDLPAPCPSGSFTELWNYIDKCLRCGVCGHSQVEKTACSPDSDRQCECKQGYHYEARSDMCVRHSECPPGQEVLSRGTLDKDTVCRICPNRHLLRHHLGSPQLLGAQELQRCRAGAGAEGLHVARQHTEPTTFREILPAFFVHQKMSIRRLRRIVNHLNRADGHFRHNLSDLHVQINSWVASATPEQIRQLPDILMKAGANGAAERLQNKLQRIDSNLQTLGNEVELTDVDNCLQTMRQMISVVYKKVLQGGRGRSLYGRQREDKAE